MVLQQFAVSDQIEQEKLAKDFNMQLYRDKFRHTECEEGMPRALRASVSEEAERGRENNFHMQFPAFGSN